MPSQNSSPSQSLSSSAKFKLEQSIEDVILDVEANESVAKAEAEEAARNGNRIARGRTGRGRPQYGSAYQEIKNLLWARKHPVFKVALEEWDRKQTLVSTRVDRREKRSADLTNQIFNLVGFYSVFQGVVLTAVAQLVAASNCKSLCGKVWVPIVLTVVAAVVTVVAIWEKFAILTKLEQFISEEKRSQGEAVKRGEDVRKEGELFRFQSLKEELEYQKTKSFWKNKIVVIVVLVLFTGIFILSYFVFLCDLGVIERWQSGF